MAWSIELDDEAEKELSKFDNQVARRVAKFLHRLSGLENPRSSGEALTGSKLGHYWKYRMGDYRIIAEIQEKALRILVVRLGNRRKIYRR